MVLNGRQTLDKDQGAQYNTVVLRRLITETERRGRKERESEGRRVKDEATEYTVHTYDVNLTISNLTEMLVYSNSYKMAITKPSLIKHSFKTQAQFQKNATVTELVNPHYLFSI